MLHPRIAQHADWKNVQTQSTVVRTRLVFEKWKVLSVAMVVWLVRTDCKVSTIFAHPASLVKWHLLLRSCLQNSVGELAISFHRTNINFHKIAAHIDCAPLCSLSLLTNNPCIVTSFSPTLRWQCMLVSWPGQYSHCPQGNKQSNVQYPRLIHPLVFYDKHSINLPLIVWNLRMLIY